MDSAVCNCRGRSGVDLFSSNARWLAEPAALHKHFLPVGPHLGESRLQVDVLGVGGDPEIHRAGTRHDGLARQNLRGEGRLILHRSGPRAPPLGVIGECARCACILGLEVRSKGQSSAVTGGTANFGNVKRPRALPRLSDSKSARKWFLRFIPGDFFRAGIAEIHVQKLDNLLPDVAGVVLVESVHADEPNGCAGREALGKNSRTTAHLGILPGDDLKCRNFDLRHLCRAALPEGGVKRVLLDCIQQAHILAAQRLIRRANGIDLCSRAHFLAAARPGILRVATRSPDVSEADVLNPAREKHVPIEVANNRPGNDGVERRRLRRGNE